MSKSDLMPAEKRRRIHYDRSSSSSDSITDDNMKRDPETMEKSLTNLKINIHALAGKIEDMMTAFQNFSEQFKANHDMLVEDMQELKDVADEGNFKIYQKGSWSSSEIWRP